MRFCKPLALIGLLFAADAAHASRVFNLSLTPDIAVYKRTEKVTGVTLSIWGENETHGVGIGIVNGTRGHSVGLSFGIVNYGESFTGAQISAVNWTTKEFVGFQWGLVNLAYSSMTGLQAGAFNYAEKLSGVQFGLVNYAEKTSSGVQIGLVNVIPMNKSFFGDFPGAVAPYMLLANWRFN